MSVFCFSRAFSQANAHDDVVAVGGSIVFSGLFFIYGITFRGEMVLYVKCYF